MLDACGRQINYLRVSVTDKCNLRCRYCMPDGVELIPMQDLLTMEEITRIVSCGVKLGIDRVKLTGGEPLVRRGIVELMRLLVGVEGLSQVTMTTNGILLRRYLPDLIRYGLAAVNISLDSMDREVYRDITGFDALDEVLAAIDAAVSAGIRVKVNAVLLEDKNPMAWQDLILLAKDMPVDVRFIELMPIGEGAGMKGVSGDILYRQIRDVYPEIAKDSSVHGNGPAVYYRIPGFKGSIGFISAMHHKFCSSCNRVRLTATGQLKPCLCYADSTDLREILRTRGDAAVLEAMKAAIYGKPAAHCFEMKEKITEDQLMSSIGG